jgi:hypothetical protein
MVSMNHVKAGEYSKAIYSDRCWILKGWPVRVITRLTAKRNTRDAEITLNKRVIGVNNNNNNNNKKENHSFFKLSGESIVPMYIAYYYGIR